MSCGLEQQASLLTMLMGLVIFECLLTCNFLALGNSSCFDGQVLPIESDQVSPSVFRLVPVVCTNGFPVTICNRGFDDQDAAVVCRSIGQSIGLQFSGKCTHFLFLIIKCYTTILSSSVQVVEL